LHHASPLFPFHPASNPIRAGTDFKNDYDVLAAGYTAAYGEFTATTGLTLPELLGEEDGPVIVVHGADGGRIACAKLECERKGYDWW